MMKKKEVAELHSEWKACMTTSALAEGLFRMGLGLIGLSVDMMDQKLVKGGDVQVAKAKTVKKGTAKKKK